MVGKAVNCLTGYLAAVSRNLPRPLAVVVQSTSGGGAAGGGRFVVGSSGVIADTAPDLPALARMHAEELIAMGGKVPRAASAAVDTSTWTPYFGQSGSIPEVLDPQLASRFPVPNLQRWLPGNCAEFEACNSAVLNGASIDNLIYSTVKISRSGIEPSRHASTVRQSSKGQRRSCRDRAYVPRSTMP